ncbi:MAG: tRNA (adenosine(37)-N6)-threonylcarbamoyltransferase complex ATPase subunit type 1 TsaE [Proteobacteria bacterium]|nr:tRNA (adenosine(37)-N6)-threonylcarbamoyltransferase complex ATPase subunit type 1 TsaE [Pseudomonadota bacterium]
MKANLISSSPEETLRIGKELGQVLEPGMVVLLSGELGSGKTVFTKGLALGLGIADPDLITSPSFIIMNIYPARVPIYHIDLYRIDDLRGLENTGLEEYLGGDGIAVVEWGERLPRSYLPESWIKIVFEMTGAEDRSITISGPARFVPKRLQNTGQ